MRVFLRCHSWMRRVTNKLFFAHIWALAWCCNGMGIAVKYCIFDGTRREVCFLANAWIAANVTFEGAIYTLLERYPDCAGKGHSTTGMICWMKRVIS